MMLQETKSEKERLESYVQNSSRHGINASSDALLYVQSLVSGSHKNSPCMYTHKNLNLQGKLGISIVPLIWKCIKCMTGPFLMQLLPT